MSLSNRCILYWVIRLRFQNLHFVVILFVKVHLLNFFAWPWFLERNGRCLRLLGRIWWTHDHGGVAIGHPKISISKSLHSLALQHHHLIHLLEVRILLIWHVILLLLLEMAILEELLVLIVRLMRISHRHLRHLVSKRRMELVLLVAILVVLLFTCNSSFLRVVVVLGILKESMLLCNHLGFSHTIGRLASHLLALLLSLLGQLLLYDFLGLLVRETTKHVISEFTSSSALLLPKLAPPLMSLVSSSSRILAR